MKSCLRRWSFSVSAASSRSSTTLTFDRIAFLLSCSAWMRVCSAVTADRRLLWKVVMCWLLQQLEELRVRRPHRCASSLAASFALVGDMVVGRDKVEDVLAYASEERALGYLARSGPCGSAWPFASRWKTSSRRCLRRPASSAAHDGDQPLVGDHAILDHGQVLFHALDDRPSPFLPAKKRGTEPSSGSGTVPR